MLDNRQRFKVNNRTAGFLRMAADELFLAVSGVYCFFLASLTSTFYFSFPGPFVEILFRVMIAAAVLRTAVIIAGPDRDKGILRMLLLSMIPVILSYLSYRSLGYLTMPFLAVMFVGFAGMDQKKILRMFLISVSAMVIPSILASLGGAIVNFVHANPRGLRSSWGIDFPTDFISIILFLLMTLFVFLPEVSELFFLPLCLLVMVISVWIARSVTGVVGTAAFTMIVLLLPLYRRSNDGSERWRTINKLARGIIPAAFPFFMLVALGLLFLVQRGYISILASNEFTHERMINSVNALNNYGIKAFGTAFEMIGAGSSAMGIEDYNFLDVTYILLLIRFGWVILLSACAVWVYMTVRAMKKGNMRMALVMGVIALLSLSEHHFPEANYNIFFVMAFADLAGKKSLHRASVRGTPDGQKGGRERVILLAVISLCIAGFLLILPYTLSLFRTVIKGYGYVGEGNHLIPVYLILLGICIAAGVFTWVLSTAISGYAVRKTVPGWKKAAIVLFIIMTAAGYWRCNDMMDKMSIWLLKDVEPDIPILTEIRDSADGKLYIERYPEIYARQMKGISRSVLAGEDLARLKDTTVVVDREFDGQCFIKKAFLYMPISEESAIYTNDQGVIRAMEASGRHLNAFFSSTVEVDLGYMAKINGDLVRTTYGSIIMDGRSLVYGPYIDLYEDDYVVSYSLKIDPEPYEEDYEVADLRVHTYWGKYVPAEKKVYRSQFDENGELTVELGFYVWSGRAAEFLVFAPEGMQYEVTGISYRHWESEDVHFRIDDKGRRIHEEYYTNEGERLSMYGFYSMDYVYDDDDNIIAQRYMDADGNTVMSDWGYAEIRRIYGSYHLLEREEYYDDRGKLVNLPSGQAFVEYTYDRNGNMLSESYFDADGNAVKRDGTIHRREYEYDQLNRRVSEAYFGNDNEPINVYDRYHKRVVAYDDKDRIIREEFYDIEGGLVMLPEGFAVIEYEYDETGAQSVLRCLDANGNEVDG